MNSSPCLYCAFYHLCSSHAPPLDVVYLHLLVDPADSWVDVNTVTI